MKLLPLLMVVVALPSFGQGRRVYPVPTETAEVKALRQESRPMVVTRTDVTLPSSVDNSKLKYFPAIFEQRGGSCAQSSGIRYLFTYEMNRYLDRDAQASSENTFSYFYTWNFLNEGKDQGGFAEQGLSIAKKQGVMSLADFPEPSTYYGFPWMTGYEKYVRSMRYRVKEVLSFGMTTQADIDAARRYLYDCGNGSEHGGVLSFSSLAEDWKFDTNYSGPSETGYHYLLTKLATDGAHAMTIVGYDDTVEKEIDGEVRRGAFIVANSYGTWWGDKGFYYLPYYFFLSEHNSQVLSHDATGCTVEVREPQVVFRVKVSYSSRNDLAFVMGVADKPYALSPTLTVNSAIADNQGGDHPMQGANASTNDVELAFDFSDMAAQAKGYAEPKYFLNVVRSEKGKLGEGSIMAFSVVDYRDASGPKVYTYDFDAPVPLAKGSNLFGLATTALKTTSASAIQWLNNLGQPYSYPYVMRTQSGKYAKFDVTSYDSSSGRATIRYYIRRNGSRDLGTLK